MADFVDPRTDPKPDSRWTDSALAQSLDQVEGLHCLCRERRIEGDTRKRARHTGGTVLFVESTRRVLQPCRSIGNHSLRVTGSVHSNGCRGLLTHGPTRKALTLLPDDGEVLPAFPLCRSRVTAYNPTMDLNR